MCRRGRKDGGPTLRLGIGSLFGNEIYYGRPGKGNVSYCRWSSNNWDCDLYCYEDVSGGFTTHVAGNRIDGQIPQEDWTLIKDNPGKFMEQHAAQMKFLETCTRSKIGLPHDGATFNDPDLESFLGRVLELQAMGYHVPPYVAESIREEIAERDAAADDRTKT